MVNEVNKGPALGMRHVQGVLIFFNIVVIYISRLNIGVAVVAMTNANTTNPDFPEFDWNEKEISYIFSSFFWGYLMTQFLGGVLSRRFGTKVTLGIAVLLIGISTALTPSFVFWGGWQAFCGLRFVQGLVQGVVFPAIYQHLAKWAPVEERNRLCAVSLTGIDFGVVVALALSGLIAEGPLGWPGISYVSAGFCLIWCVLWLIFGANSSSESRFITDAEKLYIQSSLANGNDTQTKNIPVPWKAIMTSMPFLALVIARCASGWGLKTLEAQIPPYLHGVLNMKIKSNALFSSLPFMAAWIMTYGFVIMADALQNKKILSVTGVRKLFNSIGFWVPAAGLIAIGFLNENNKALAIALMTMNVGSNSAATIGNGLNAIDLSPNHAGILMGIINTISNIVSFISPLVVGVVVTDWSNSFQWQIVFALAAAIFIFGDVVFLIFGSGVAQPWDATDFLSLKDVESSKLNVKYHTVPSKSDDNNMRGSKKNLK